MLKKNEFSKKIGEQFIEFVIYPESVNDANGCKLFLAKVDGQQQLIIVEEEATSNCAEFQACRTIQQAKAVADEFVAANTIPYDRIKLAVLALGLPPEFEPYIAKEWERAGFQPLVTCAPYAAHVLTVELFFHIARECGMYSSPRALSGAPGQGQPG